MEHNSLEVWFRSFSFLFMVDGCRFQPFISQMCTMVVQSVKKSTKKTKSKPQGWLIFCGFKVPLFIRIAGFLPSWRFFFARPVKKIQQISINISHINHSSTKHSVRFNVILVGGFNPFEKYDRQNGFIFRKNQMNTTKN